MGYGADILTTLHYYTIGDPLNLLSALVLPQYTEYLYNFLILLRMYLAGAAFSAYCLYRGRTHAAALLGTSSRPGNTLHQTETAYIDLRSAISAIFASLSLVSPWTRL